jgi:hypothetical protein
MSTMSVARARGWAQSHRTMLLSAMLLVPGLSMAQFDVTRQSGELTARVGEQVMFAGGGGFSNLDEKTAKLQGLTSGSQGIEVSAQIATPSSSSFGLIPTTASLSTAVSGREVALQLRSSVLGNLTGGSLTNGVTSTGGGGINAKVDFAFDLASPTDVLLALDHTSIANQAGLESLSEGWELKLYKLDPSKSVDNLKVVWSDAWNANPGNPFTPVEPGDVTTSLNLDQGSYDLVLSYSSGRGYITSYSALPQARDLALRMTAVPEASTLTMWLLGCSLLWASSRHHRAVRRA